MSPEYGKEEVCVCVCGAASVNPFDATILRELTVDGVSGKYYSLPDLKDERVGLSVLRNDYAKMIAAMRILVVCVCVCVCCLKCWCTGWGPSKLGLSNMSPGAYLLWAVFV